MLDEHVLLAHGGEQVDRLGALGRREVRVGAREELRELEVAAVDVGDGEEAAQVERRRQAVDLAVADLQLAGEHVEDLGVDVVLDLEPDGRTEATPGQLLLEGGEEVLGVVLLDLEVLVARDAEAEVLLHEHPGEELVEVARDDVLERHEALALHLGVEVLLDEDEARQARRHLDAGEVLAARLGVLEQHREVERQAGDVGERVRRVDGERREHGEDALGEEVVEGLTVVLVEVVPAHDGDALLLEGRTHVVLEDAGVLLHQLVREPGDALDELARLEPGGGAHGQPGGDAALEARDADHEVLVEVVGEDREEAGALEERHGGVHGELEHPLVELQPGQLALEVAVCRQVVLVVALRSRADEPAVGGAGRDAAVGDGARERADLGRLARRLARAVGGGVGRSRDAGFRRGDVLLVQVGGGEAAGAHATIVAPKGDVGVNSSQPTAGEETPPTRSAASPASAARANWRCTSTSSKPRAA